MILLNNFLYFILGIALSLFFSFLVFSSIIKRKNFKLNFFRILKLRNKEKIIFLKNKVKELNSLKEKIDNLNKIIQDKDLELCKLNIENKEFKYFFNEKNFFEKNFKIEFEKFFIQILEKKENKFVKKNFKSLSEILIPFKKKIKEFREEIRKSSLEETKERNILINEVQNIRKLNKKITEEASKLTQALKGNSKVQGIWGEMILTKILESSGLRLGYEYEFQKSIRKEGIKYYPDVILYLPNNKYIVIDSKISLVNYEKYYSNNIQKEKDIYLKKYINSVKNHIRELGEKNYQTSLSNLNSLDYILMFIPIENAYLLAIEKNFRLIEEGLSNNVLLVSPSTLLIAIKIIDSIWSYNKQEKNLKTIIDRVKKISDKIRLIIEDVYLLGKNTEKIRLIYSSLIKKITEGKGNLIKQMKILEELGISSKKKIHNGFKNKN